MAGREDEGLNKAADGQALSMLKVAWGYVFEAPTGMLHFMDIRYWRCVRTMLHSVDQAELSGMQDVIAL